MDLACYYVLDGNAFKEIKREVGCSFLWSRLIFYCRLLSISRYILKIADILKKSLIKVGESSIYLKNRRYNFSYRFTMSLVVKAKLTNTPFFILQKCKVIVMLTNSSSAPKRRKIGNGKTSVGGYI